MISNPPTPAQAERLAILAEECAEVIQCVTKIQRHGWQSIGRWLPTEQVSEAFGGRLRSPGPCNYAGGGLFGLNPVQLDGEPHRYFELAEAS